MEPIPPSTGTDELPESAPAAAGKAECSRQAWSRKERKTAAEKEPNRIEKVFPGPTGATRGVLPWGISGSKPSTSRSRGRLTPGEPRSNSRKAESDDECPLHNARYYDL